MIVVEQQPARHDVGRRGIGLELDQVASAQQVIGVGAVRKFLDVDVVVLRFQTVEEPCAVALQRPGKGDAGNEFVKANSIGLPERGKKVGGVEAEFVVTHSGVERHDAPSASAELDRIACRLLVDGANRIGADAKAKNPADRRANIESIQRVQSRPGLRSGHVHLASRIRNHARIERQQVADVARGGVGHIDDLRQIHGALIGGLLRVYAGDRGSYADLLEHHLLVIEDNSRFPRERIDLAQYRLIEPRLFDAHAVGLFLLEEVRSLSGVIGRKANLRVSRLKNDHLRA